MVTLAVALLGLLVWTEAGALAERALPDASFLVRDLVPPLMAATIAFAFGFIVPRRFWLWGLAVFSTYPFMRAREEILLFRDNPCYEMHGRPECYRDLFTPEYIPFFVLVELSVACAWLILCLAGAALGAGLRVLLRRLFRGGSRREATPAR